MASMDMESSKHATPDTLLHKQKAQGKKQQFIFLIPQKRPASERSDRRQYTGNPPTTTTSQQ